MSIESLMPSNHLILCCPLLLLPSISLSIRVFSNDRLFASGGQNIETSASASVLPNEHSGLISFGIDWFDLPADQGTLKNLLQHHNLKASILLCSAFFIVQISRPYITTRKTISLSLWTFVRKVMSLLFNMQSRFVIAFLPRRFSIIHK